MINVIVPSYNCGDYIFRCLSSLKNQTINEEFKVLVIDDASDQVGYSLLTETLCDYFGFQYHRNDINLKCPFNLKLGIEILNPEEEDIIFILDGDDFLPNNSLDRINKIYSSNSNVWLTYGNYQPHPSNTGQTLASQYPSKIVRRRDFRTAPSHFNHPITFKKFLWDQIDDKDLQTDDGRWFTGGYDRVIMAPMLEMASDNYKFIDETLYYYNAVNPLSDVFVNLSKINESDQVLSRQKKEKLYRG